MVKDDHSSWWFMISGWFAMSFVDTELTAGWLNFLSWLWLLRTCNKSMLAPLSFHLTSPLAHPREEPWPDIILQWEDQVPHLKYSIQFGYWGKQGCRVHSVHVSFGDLSAMPSCTGRQKLFCHKPSIKSCLHTGPCWPDSKGNAGSMPSSLFQKEKEGAQHEGGNQELGSVLHSIVKRVETWHKWPGSNSPSRL